MSLKRAKISLTGTKPILINTFPLETLDEGKSKGGTSGKNENEWKQTVLMNANRELYIHSTYIVKSMIEGGKNIKAGRGSISKKVAATLECEDSIIYLNGLKVPAEDQLTKNPMDAVYLDVRAVTNPMTKGKNIRYRIAAKKGWQLSTTIAWDDSAASVEQMKQSLIYAGSFQGLGDGRSIGFGRFTLDNFEIIKD